MVPTASLPPLGQAESVLRLSAPALAALAHVPSLLSDFLDVSTRFSLAVAASSGSVLLLTRVATRLQSDPQRSPALLSHWFAGAMQAAIEHNDLAMVRKVHELHPAPLVVDSLKLAMQHGSLELVQWAVNNRHDRLCCAPGVENLCHECLSRALLCQEMKDAVKVVEWLLEEGFPLQLETDGFTLPPLNHFILRSASLVRWFDERGLLSDEAASRLLSSTISNASADTPAALDVAQYLLARGYTLSRDELIQALTCGACQRRKEALIDFIWSSPLCDGIRDDVDYAAIRPGGAKVLQWSREFMGQRENELFTSQMAFSATHFGHLDSVEWLYEARGIRPSEAPFQKYASEEELLRYLKWMQSRGFNAWTSHDMDVAALWGHLEVVKWLHVNSPAGCTADAMDFAAQNGHLPIVEWLHHNRTEGCTSAASKLAASNAHLEVVKWLFENRSESNTTETMASAAGKGHLEVVEWLHNSQSDGCLSCAADATVNLAAGEGGALDALRWLVERGATISACAVPYHTPTEGWLWLGEYAAARGDLQLLQFLGDHFRRTEAGATLALVYGITDHLPVVQWLHEKMNDTVDWEKLRRIAEASKQSHVIAWLDSVAA